MNKTLINKYLSLIHLIVNDNTSNLSLPTKIVKLKAVFRKIYDERLMEKELLSVGVDNGPRDIMKNYSMFKCRAIAYKNNLSPYIEPDTQLSFSYIKDKFGNKNFLWELGVMADSINEIAGHTLFADVMFNNYEFNSPEFLLQNN